MTEVFVEQPLASPGSAKYLETNKLQPATYFSSKKNPWSLRVSKPLKCNFTLWNPICEGFWVGSCDHGQKAQSADKTAVYNKREEILNYINREGREAAGERGLGKRHHVCEVLWNNLSKSDGDRAIAGRGTTRDIKRHIDKGILQ